LTIIGCNSFSIPQRHLPVLVFFPAITSLG
jgi:hypothetical protein